MTLLTRMGLFRHCVLLLFVSTYTVAFDFHRESKRSGQSVFVKRLNIEEKAAKIVKRSLPAWLAASPNHKIKRRSTEQGDSCKAVEGHDTKLADNTHSVSYQLKSCYTSLVWQVNELREDGAQVLNRCTNRPNELWSVLYCTMGCFPFNWKP